MTRNGSFSELARLGFSELSVAMQQLETLVELVGDVGHVALDPISSAASPDQALHNLIELAKSEPKLIKKILAHPENALALIRVIGLSEGLNDFLRRRPQALDIFLSKPRLKDKQGYLSQLQQPVVEDAIVSMRLRYREALLEIAAFDLCLEDSASMMSEISAALSDLAAATLERSLEIARVIESENHERALTVPLSVIGMGKAGARELNYVSDVDVIFVTATEVTDEDLKIATRLATRLMRQIDSAGVEPALWEVDANLRPEGKDGAMVRRLAAHVAYYEKWAKNWEFQALIKARLLAGDEDLGEQYQLQIRNRSWSAVDNSSLVESIRAMRQRVLDHIPKPERERELKLGSGGLRDVEFTIQLMQLVHGRLDDSVHQRGTLEAIAALAQASYLGRADAAKFDSHYRYLRTVEHRLQLRQLRRTHLLPESESQQRLIARSIDPSNSAAEFSSQLEKVRSSVRELHETVFFRPLLNSTADLSADEVKLSDDQVLDRLNAMGFADPKSATAHLNALTKGVSRRAAIQKQLLPHLLKWFAQGTNPDRSLLFFRRLSEDLGDSHWFLGMLRDSSGAAFRLSQLLSHSDLALTLLERNPQAVAWLANDDELVNRSYEGMQIEIDAVFSRHEESEKIANGISKLRRKETLRLAMGAILGVLSLEQVQRGLTDLNDIYLSNLSRLILKDSELDFGIVAMGRYGGAELGFGSDADVMFVYRGASDYQSEGEKLVSQLRTLTKDPILPFELDIELRPEGKNGPVIRSIDSYRSYYQRWSEIWESQALLRARVIYGSDELVEEFTELISSYRYPANLTEANINEVRRIKARVESERLPLGANPNRHLKLGRGSLSDVEWLVQLYQLKYANTHPSIQTPQTLLALKEMANVGLISGEQAEVLSIAWRISSRIRSAIFLATGRHNDSLPSDVRILEPIARILSYPNHSAAQLEEDYLAATRRSRVVFEELFYKK